MTEMHVGNVLLEFPDDLGQIAAVARNLEAFTISILRHLGLSLVELAD